MILPDREIKLALASERIIIDPRPAETSFSSTSVDLTLLDQAFRWIHPTAGLDLKIAPGTPGYEYESVRRALTEPVPLEGGVFTIRPGDFMLAWTREVIELPVENGIAARVEGKSSLGRIGIGVHVTAPTIHAGFKGNVQLEMSNHAAHPVSLTPGMKICQVIFELTLGTPEKAYSGQFRGQQA